MGFDLVFTERDDIAESAMTLYGFDEVGLFDNQFTNPVYGFLKFN